MKQSTIVSSSKKSEDIHAEITWAVNVVLSNYSFNSSLNKSDISWRMFPDSSIDKNFTCGKTKCSYVISFGVALCFKLICEAKKK